MTSRSDTDVKPARFGTGSRLVLLTDSQAGQGCHQYLYCHGKAVPSPCTEVSPQRAAPEYALPVRRWVHKHSWVSLETYTVCEQHIPLTASLSAWTHAHITPFPLKESYHRNLTLHLIWCNCRFLSKSAVRIPSSSLSLLQVPVPLFVLNLMTGLIRGILWRFFTELVFHQVWPTTSARSSAKGTTGTQSQGWSWERFWQRLPLNRLRYNTRLYVKGTKDVYIIWKPETTLRKRVKTGDKQEKVCKIAETSINALWLQAIDPILLLLIWSKNHLLHSCCLRLTLNSFKVCSKSHSLPENGAVSHIPLLGFIDLCAWVRPNTCDLAKFKRQIMCKGVTIYTAFPWLV